jgi:hypothetical protein
MNQYISQWWTVQLPDGWSADEDTTCVTIHFKPALGALQLSAARNSTNIVTDDDLRELAKEHLDAGARIKSVICGLFTGFYLHYSYNEIYQRQWWLRCGDTVILATYTSDLKIKGQEDIAVDNILNTLKINDK